MVSRLSSENHAVVERKLEAEIAVLGELQALSFKQKDYVISDSPKRVKHFTPDHIR